MNILSLSALESPQVDQIATEDSAPADRNDAIFDARTREEFRAVLFAVTFCGAVINRDTIQFARAVAELLQWSAEHARQRMHSDLAETIEWQCDRCGEMSPENFDLCWNCESLHEPECDS